MNLRLTSWNLYKQITLILHYHSKTALIYVDHSGTVVRDPLIRQVFEWNLIIKWSLVKLTRRNHNKTQQEAKTWTYPDSKVHRANMGPTWVLSAPDGPHDGPMNLAIRVVIVMYRNITAYESRISKEGVIFSFHVSSPWIQSDLLISGAPFTNMD